jgi:hypothetical protein
MSDDTEALFHSLLETLRRDEMVSRRWPPRWPLQKRSILLQKINKGSLLGPQGKMEWKINKRQANLHRKPVDSKN